MRATAVDRCRGRRCPSRAEPGPGPAPWRRPSRAGPVHRGHSQSVSPSRISQQVAYIALNTCYSEISKNTDLMRATAVVGRREDRSRQVQRRRPSRAGPVHRGHSRSVSPSRISQQVGYIALNTCYSEISKNTDLMRATAVVGRREDRSRQVQQTAVVV